MAAFPQFIPAASFAYGTPGPADSLTGLDLLLLKVEEQVLRHQLAKAHALSCPPDVLLLKETMEERVLRHQLAKAQALSCPPDVLLLKETMEERVLRHQLAQAKALSCAPPGLEHPCLAPRVEDDRSTMCSSQNRTCDDSQSDHSLSQPEHPQTTLMIRNVPVLYTRDMLATELLSEGAKGSCDFLYLPCCSSQRNLSFAFVNFTSEAAAVVFARKWQKQRLARFSSNKPLNVSFADVQGLEPNLLELKKKRVSRLKDGQCQPLIFANGRSVSMSEALKALADEKQKAFQVGQIFSL